MKRFKEICREQGIKYVDIADDLEVSLRTVERWAKDTPKLSRVWEIAEYLEVPVEDLFTDDEQVPHTRLGKTGELNKAQLFACMMARYKREEHNNFYSVISGKFYHVEKEQFIDAVMLSVSAADLFARMHRKFYSMEMSETIDIPNSENQNCELEYKMEALDCFHWRVGKLHNNEVNEFFENVEDYFVRYGQPIYAVLCTSDYGSLFLHLLKICEDIFLPEVHGEIVCLCFLTQLIEDTSAAVDIIETQN